MLESWPKTRLTWYKTHSPNSSGYIRSLLPLRTLCLKILSQVVEKFDDLRKFVDTDGVKQHMQATRSLSTSTHPSLVVHLLPFLRLVVTIFNYNQNLQDCGGQAGEILGGIGRLSERGHWGCCWENVRYFQRDPQFLNLILIVIFQWRDSIYSTGIGIFFVQVLLCCYVKSSQWWCWRYQVVEVWQGGGCRRDQVLIVLAANLNFNSG